jgi:hypothetical protein
MDMTMGLQRSLPLKILTGSLGRYMPNAVFCLRQCQIQKGSVIYNQTLLDIPKPEYRRRVSACQWNGATGKRFKVDIPVFSFRIR